MLAFRSHAELVSFRLFSVFRDSQVEEAVGFLTKPFDKRFNVAVFDLYDYYPNSLLGERGKRVTDSLRDTLGQIRIGDSGLRELSKPTPLPG